MKGSKRQDFPMGLWVVATPIGNLADISERAQAALSRAVNFYCEDTRVTQKLLQALGISWPKDAEFFRLDGNSSAKDVSHLAEKVLQQASLDRATVLVSDAGTPGVSDPGSLLVRKVRALGGQVYGFAGPSAVTSFLSAAGFREGPFSFRGFFPRKVSEKRQELEICASSRTSSVFIWFESPHRMVETLELISETYPKHYLVAAKELTKIFEKFFSGEACEVLAQVKAEVLQEGERGEWCLGMEWEAREKNRSTEAESSDWVKALHCLLDAQVSASTAAKQVSQHFGVMRKISYKKSLELFGKKTKKGG